MDGFIFGVPHKLGIVRSRPNVVVWFVKLSGSWLPYCTWANTDVFEKLARERGRTFSEKAKRFY